MTPVAATEPPQPKPGPAPAASELEILLPLTLLCVCINMVPIDVVVVVANIVFAALSVIILGMVWVHGREGDVLPKWLAPRVNRTVERCSYFPFEGLIVLGWPVLIALRVMQSPYREPFSTVLALVALALSGSARRALRDPFLVREQRRFASAREFCRWFMSAAFRRERRQRIRQRLAEAADRLTHDGGAGVLPATPGAADGTGAEPQRRDREQERRLSEMDNRYNRWVEEESDRLRDE